MTSEDAAGRQLGVLGDWNDDRGFGFITPASGGSRVFAHVSAFPRGRRPVPGNEVTYVRVRDGRDRARAADVRYVGRASATRSVSKRTSSAVAMAVAFFALLTTLLLLDELPVWLVGVYAASSAVAVVMYGADKSAATAGKWRTPESTLHTIALLGGWPGALAAQQVFRHKTTKQPFRSIFWVTVLANSAALGWFLNQF